MTGRGRTGRQPRRGVTLIIVAITLTVFLGFAALAIDLARLVNFRGELKGTADAAAMSAALDLIEARTQATATTNVTTLVGRNPIEGTGSATVTAVAPITWDFSAGTATTAASWGVANGARVIVSYPLNWTLAKVFNRGTGRTLVDTSIAAFGQRSTHDCLRPVVFPYSALRAQLSLSPVNDTTSLTAANVYTLGGLTSPATYTVLDTVNAANATAFGWVNTKQGSSGSASDLVSALSSCVSGTLGAGSTLQARPRFGDTTSIRTAASTLCGSTTNCSANNVILVPIYTSGTNTNGTTTTTTTSTPAPNQSVTLTVSKNCYNSSTSTTYNATRCSAWVSTLQTASASTPVLLTNGGTTYSCQVGPTYTGRGISGGGNNATYYLYFQYSTCFTTTTTTVGSARSASTYVIKYIAGFVWTSRTNTTLTGYFTTLNYPPSVGVSWDELPGPVTSVVLVK